MHKTRYLSAGKINIQPSVSEVDRKRVSSQRSPACVQGIETLEIGSPRYATEFTQQDAALFEFGGEAHAPDAQIVDAC